MDDGSKNYTAFGCEFGLFHYNVMAMGLTNATATFQRMMNDILAGYIDDFVIVYLDDILIYSSDIKSHMEHVKLVLKRLEENSLKNRQALNKCRAFWD